MARVSIITATYNRSDVLRCAIESVRAQTYRDWEYVIVGDACTDNTAGIVAEFRDPKIRFVNRETNCGEQSAPNNDGFRLASGRLIAYLNHDDLWFRCHLEGLVTFIEQTGADLVYSIPFSIDRNGLTFCGVTNAELRYDPTHLIPASLWLARRELIEELGGWRSATAIHASMPSQDLLTRAWQRTKDLRCLPRVTAIFLASGGRPKSFVNRDDRQHRELLADMADSGFRERLLVDWSLRSARDLHQYSVRRAGLRARLDRGLDRMFVLFGLRPDAVRNWAARRPKGWWIDHIRQFGGLGPLNRDGGDKQ